MDLFQHLNTNMGPAPVPSGAMPARKRPTFPGKFKGQKGAIFPQPLGGRGPLNRKYHAPTAGVRTRPFSAMSAADHTHIDDQLNRVGVSFDRYAIAVDLIIF